MAAGLFLVERTDQGDNSDRNGVRAIIVNDDDAQTDAQIIATAIATMNTTQAVESGAEDQYPAGYFQTVVQVGATPAGPLATDGDLLVYKREVMSVRT
jgi:hypothetical protein